MKQQLAIVIAIGVGMLSVAGAQSRPDTTEAHCAAAKAAAGTEHINLYNRFADVCGGQQPAAAPNPQPRRGGPPPQSTWYHEPAKVFDNLYFVGTNEHASWAVQTSEGLIVIDALFDYAVRDEVVASCASSD